MWRSALLLIFIAFFSVSCSRKEKVNLDEIDYQLQIHRFEDAIMQVDLNNMEQEVERLHQKYGNFLDLFSQEIIQIGPVGNPSYPDLLKTFVTDFMINDVYNQVKEKFQDISGFQKRIENGLKRYQYYFEKNPPMALTYISGFNHSMAMTDTIIGIGLDKYLGSDNSYYDQLGYARYIRQNMVPKKIPSDFMKAMAMTLFDYDDSNDNLLRQMIYHGKIMYFVERMLPQEHDSLKFGFTNEQLQFCRDHEGQMWVYLIENKLLFTTDQFTIIKFIGEAPYTKGFTRDSPGQAAIWIGYRIVNRFMKETDEYNLADLMAMDNYQFILEESHYNP